MTDTTMEQRLTQVRARIEQCCHAAGRHPDEVQLLPVSKTFADELIVQAQSLGLLRFGENRAQDLRARFEAFSQTDIQWVMIGHTQTNKARDIARYAHELQSLDRLSLAEALERRLQREGRALDVLIQIKTAHEESKFGLDPQDLPDFLQQLKAFSTLRVRGLMTMATQTDDSDEIRRCFALARQWRDRLRAEGHEECTRLSMGMSGDFELAIAEGATEVRLGSAIFGTREGA
ncbi:MAG TPA: YggS family pyridoxal phosphate-dependent enzyme [Paenalcaligenes sp.]|nr:YggS family pyridoxal phosphate-dependent enzyme [Paenalcaligenes sp.]